MKQLIKPTFITSFILMLSGLVPDVVWYMPLFGIISLAMSGIMGVILLGSEDRDYLAQLELIRLEHAKAVELVATHEKKYEELKTQISKAISENRDLLGRIR